MESLIHEHNQGIFKTIYFTLFDSHLHYAAVWGTQNKSLQIISFKEPAYPLYANHKIVKLQNIIALNKCLFIYNQLCDNLPKRFLKLFQTS